ncbi:C2 family cysteine protease [Streptomyces europaeiscabiei]|nr:C2 family cysteine protease [Streptomyces europaeiscabiei]MDX3618853.1 C2 family cysteine protease [Streptomyces europaeiscabiei]
MEPIEPTEPTALTEPTESAEPTEAMQPTEHEAPARPMEAAEPEKPAEHEPPAEDVDAPAPVGSTDAPDPIEAPENLRQLATPDALEAPAPGDAPNPEEPAETDGAPAPFRSPEPRGASDPPTLFEVSAAHEAPEPHPADDPVLEEPLADDGTFEAGTADGRRPEASTAVTDMERVQDAPEVPDPFKAEDSGQAPEGGFFGQLREALGSRGESTVEQPAPVHATIDQPNFERFELPDEGIDLCYYGTPLDGPDGRRIPLFDGPPTREQTEQGRLNDCGVIATMGAVAAHRPEVISELIRENDDGTYEVTLHQTKRSFDGDWHHFDATGEVAVLTVTPELPVSRLNPEQPLYGSGGASETAWAPILEKALAGVDQTWDENRSKGVSGYDRLDLGTFPRQRAELLTQLTGAHAYSDDFPSRYDMQGRSPDSQLLSIFREKLSDRCPVLVGTVSVDEKTKRLPKGLIGGHAYEVTKVDERGLIHLRNPYNFNNPKPLTVKELREHVKNRYTTLE